jgi:L-asparaginase / beta-aspartyl-peptidase
MTILTNSVGAVGMPAAVAALRRGQSALDTVETGIRPVEADPTIRSVGVGGWTNLLGQVELDACIMDGRTLRSGAVGAMQDYLYPISVAREVMTRLPHVLLVGDGAARFAAEIGAEAGNPLTAEAEAEWAKWLDTHVPAAVRRPWPDVPLIEWSRLTADPETAGGTTIFLVKDGNADIAAGVSTCGWAFKYPGRLGDSAIVGAGIYADNRYGAAGCTGMGELALRAGTARSLVLYMKVGLSVEDACAEALADLRALRRDYRGGLTLHALDTAGRSCVVSIGLPEPWRYWLWRPDMPAPDERRAILEQW